MYLYLYKLEAIYENNLYTYYGSRKSKFLRPEEDDYSGSPKSKQGKFIFKNPKITVTKTIIDTIFDNYKELLEAEKLLIEQHFNDQNNLNFTKNTTNFERTNSKPKSNLHKQKMSEGKMGVLNPQYGRLRTKAEKLKISKSLKGKIPYNKGAIFGSYSEDRKEKMRAGQRAKPKVICPHCQRVGAENLMKRYHFANCKSNPTTDETTGVPMPCGI